MTFAQLVPVFKFIFYVALNVIAQKAFGPKKPKTRRPSSDVEYEGTLEGRKLAFGRNKLSGMQVIEPVTHGANNVNLEQVLAHCQGPISALGDVYFDMDLVASADIGSITGALTDGVIGGSGPYAAKANVRRYTGTATQAADYILKQFVIGWTSAHQGKEVAYSAIEWIYDPAVFKNGTKPNYSVIADCWLLYDPRKDSTKTGGSGAHRDNDATTWQYSSNVGTNPALQLRRFLTDPYGLVCPSAEVIDENTTTGNVQTAANECEEVVALPLSGTQLRYTSNIVIDCTQPWEDSIKAFTAAMMGEAYWSGGRWRMFAGSWLTPSFALTPDDVLTVCNIEETPANARYNAVKGSFVDPARNYQLVEFEPRTNSTYETADVAIGRVWKELELPACNNNYEGQRYALVTNDLGRNTKKVTLLCEPANTFGILPYETGTITLPDANWTNQSVRCKRWVYQRGDHTVLLVLESATSTDWDDPATSEYTQPVPPGAPAGAFYIPKPVTDFAAVGAQNAIVFTWVLPADAVASDVTEIWEYTSSTPFSSATKVGEVKGSTLTIKKNDLTVRYYWAVQRAANKNKSDTTPLTDGITGSAASLNTAWSASVNPGSKSKVLHGTGSGTTGTPNPTVTILNGGGSPTYAWTRLSGSSTITAGSASSAATAFSVTGLADQATVNALFNCHVVDGANTADLTVNVSFFRDDGL